MSRLQIPSNAAERQHLQRQCEQRAAQCPERPLYHFRCPGGWMNDPNGTMYLNGEYHLFYQYFPYSEAGGQMSWGHAKSSDLLHWEHLPIAIEPSADRGEAECWSGCCVDDHGTPTILYTSIGSNWPQEYDATIWAANSDAQMVVWDKDPRNPVLTTATHPELPVRDWRDPYAWNDGERWWMVVGGHVVQDDLAAPKMPTAFLYSSTDLCDWTYAGPLCTGVSGGNETLQNRNPLSGDKPGEIKTGADWECPNFFPLDQTRDLYCLVVSPCHRVIANVGTFVDHEFAPGRWKVLDHGSSFYATNTFTDPSGRVLLVGWIREGGTGGWDGLTSLPRVLSLDESTNLKMGPAPELEGLRDAYMCARDISLGEQDCIDISAWTGCTDFLAESGRKLEIIAEFGVECAELPAEGNLGIRFFAAQDVKDPLSREMGVNYEEGILYAGNSYGYIRLEPRQNFHFHIFMDNSVLEIFLNEEECLTSRFHPAKDAVPKLEVFSGMASLKLKNLEMWTLKSVWDCNRGNEI